MYRGLGVPSAPALSCMPRLPVIWQHGHPTAYMAQAYRHRQAGLPASVQTSRSGSWAVLAVQPCPRRKLLPWGVGRGEQEGTCRYLQELVSSLSPKPETLHTLRAARVAQRRQASEDTHRPIDSTRLSQRAWRGPCDGYRCQRSRATLPAGRIEVHRCGLANLPGAHHCRAVARHSGATSWLSFESCTEGTRDFWHFCALRSTCRRGCLLTASHSRNLRGPRPAVLWTLNTTNYLLLPRPQSPTQQATSSHAPPSTQHTSYASRPDGLAWRRANREPSSAAPVVGYPCEEAVRATFKATASPVRQLPPLAATYQKACRSVEPRKSCWTLRLSHLKARHVNLRVLVMDPSSTTLAANLGPRGFAFLKSARPAPFLRPRTQPYVLFALELPAGAHLPLLDRLAAMCHQCCGATS